MRRETESWDITHQHFLLQLGLNDIKLATPDTYVKDSVFCSSGKGRGGHIGTKPLSAMIETLVTDAIREHVGFYIVATLVCVFTCFQKPDIPSHFAFSLRNDFG